MQKSVGQYQNNIKEIEQDMKGGNNSESNDESKKYEVLQ